jgi:3-deoxy-7-phosphoheptulonate synthase
VAQNWNAKSWRDHEARHLPVYPDAGKLNAVEDTLGSFPPLVFAGEARALKADLAQVAAGKGFCSRAGTAPKALPNSIPTTSATRSACCCRWRWCSRSPASSRW